MATKKANLPEYVQQTIQSLQNAQIVLPGQPRERATVDAADRLWTLLDIYGNESDVTEREIKKFKPALKLSERIIGEIEGDVVLYKVPREKDMELVFVHDANYDSAMFKLDAFKKATLHNEDDDEISRARRTHLQFDVFGVWGAQFRDVVLYADGQIVIGGHFRTKVEALVKDVGDRRGRGGFEYETAQAILPTLKARLAELQEADGKLPKGRKVKDEKPVCPMPKFNKAMLFPAPRKPKAKNAVKPVRGVKR